MDDQRQLAVDLFQATWALLDRDDRSADDDAAMVNAAHASLHHWSAVGGPEHRARGEWQVSRVYSVLGWAEPAMWHAVRCLAICDEHGLVDWDRAFAHEAVARASLVAGDAAAAAEHVALARAVRIADEEDRALVEADLATITA